jgi:putative nucleotidyltransferase with HDIG domain
MEISHTDNRPLYNSRIIDTYLKLIKRKYRHVNIGELLSYAKMESYQVEDEGHWFTQEQVDRFYEIVRKLTGNHNIAREAGRYAASPETLGAIKKHVLGLIGPANVYEIAGKITSKYFVRSARYESRRIGRNKVEITVTPYEGVSEKLYQCENRLGFWECIAEIFNYRLPKIQHPECMFEGGKVCRYIVSWQESHFAVWKKIRNYATLLGFAFCLGYYFIFPQFALSFPIILSSFVLLIFLLTLHAQNFERDELNSAINSLRDSSEDLVEQINQNYNQALLVNEMGLAISKHTDIDDILNSIVKILERRLDFDRGMILLANEDKTRLVFHAGFGYTIEQLLALKTVNFHLDKPDSKGVFAVSFREKRPFLISDIEEIKENLSPRSLEFAKKMGAKSFICCPIIYEVEPLGILAVDHIKTKRPLVQTDMNLLMGIAPQIGISIHNAILTEGRERQFRSILQVLAASIDARDPLTAGHSAKVTDYALGICKELSLPKDYCEMIRVASLLHDYGKIGIKDDILKKNGPLTIEEHDEIKTHVKKTTKILDQVSFEGIYQEVPKIVESHHEKIDGSGYPMGIKGDAIPLGAKIIAVADFFEAITAKRHYREPMPLDTAFGLLMEGCDIHFDRKIVEAFIRHYKKTEGKKSLTIQSTK